MTAFAVLGGGIVLGSLAMAGTLGLVVVGVTVAKVAFPDRATLTARIRLPKLPAPKRQGRHAAIPERKGLDRLVRWR